MDSDIGSRRIVVDDLVPVVMRGLLMLHSDGVSEPIGAALDFIAGTQSRAPSLTQKVGLEWAWRMLREPRRLGPRYARCIAVVPRLVARTIPQIINARMRKAA